MVAGLLFAGNHLLNILTSLKLPSASLLTLNGLAVVPESQLNQLIRISRKDQNLKI